VEQEKVCTKCGQSKPLGEFYVDPRYRFGVRSRCKVCLAAENRDYDRRHPEVMRASSMRYLQKDPDGFRERARQKYAANVEAVRAKVRERKLAEPEKWRARNAVSNGLRDGRILKPDECSVCGRSDLRIEAHHEDYMRPLDVTWLCSACHGETWRRYG